MVNIDFIKHLQYMYNFDGEHIFIVPLASAVDDVLAMFAIHLVYG